MGIEFSRDEILQVLKVLEADRTEILKEKEKAADMRRLELITEKEQKRQLFKRIQIYNATNRHRRYVLPFMLPRSMK